MVYCGTEASVVTCRLVIRRLSSSKCFTVAIVSGVLISRDLPILLWSKTVIIEVLSPSFYGVEARARVKEGRNEVPVD
ncbi:Hypothetical protein FKW44_000544 [Caligus rogercresseyi]|uniref:Uncharacterized protein n=1 Tax=Caligus rogercresseyi TaxID=217165 RepID=A0A7T8KHH6_CALRO|nr:Hypothetical protein FKW44_000544 [Caligus rogercresseyi]